MAAKRGIWDIAEVVEIILRFLPGRCVATAAQVCRLWHDTVERIRRSRRDCVVYLSPVNFGFDDFSRDAVDFISQQHIEPRALLLFLGASPSSSTVRIKSFLRSIQKCLPLSCPFIGCTGHGVVGSGMSSSRNQSENSQGLSLMMFPRCEQLEIHDFYVPLRNKYKKISGVKSFLPDMTLPVKLVIVLAHPLSLGKLTHLTVALRSKYGDSVRLCFFQQISPLFQFNINLMTAIELIMISTKFYSQYFFCHHNLVCLFKCRKQKKLRSNQDRLRSF